MLATNSKSRTLALIELGLIDLFVSHIKTFGAATPTAYSNRTLLKYVCFGITFVVTDARMYAQTRIKSSGLSDILQSLTDRLTAVQESGTLEGLSDDEVLDLEEVVELIDARCLRLSKKAVTMTTTKETVAFVPFLSSSRSQSFLD